MNFVSKRLQLYLLLVGCPVICSLAVLAHPGHSPNDNSKNQNISTPELSAYKAINEKYLREVKPIFRAKCMNCHSQEHEYPSYYTIPLVRNLIDSDIKESLEHIDMSKDFPFGGHGTPLEDLQAIAKVLDVGDMPPWSYRLMHSESKLSDADKSTIRDWVVSSSQTLHSILQELPQEKK